LALEEAHVIMERLLIARVNTTQDLITLLNTKKNKTTCSCHAKHRIRATDTTSLPSSASLNEDGSITAVMPIHDEECMTRQLNAWMPILQEKLKLKVMTAMIVLRCLRPYLL